MAGHGMNATTSSPSETRSSYRGRGHYSARAPKIGIDATPTCSILCARARARCAPITWRRVDPLSRDARCSSVSRIRLVRPVRGRPRAPCGQRCRYGHGGRGLLLHADLLDRRTCRNADDPCEERREAVPQLLRRGGDRWTRTSLPGRQSPSCCRSVRIRCRSSARTTGPRECWVRSSQGADDPPRRVPVRPHSPRWILATPQDHQWMTA